VEVQELPPLFPPSTIPASATLKKSQKKGKDWSTQKGRMVKPLKVEPLPLSFPHLSWVTDPA